MIRFIAIILVVSGLYAASLPTASPFARLIRVDVILDGKTILRGSTSDAGRQNVDDVWRSVVKSVRERSYSTTLYPTEHFKKEMLTERHGNSFSLKAPDRKAKVVIRVSYGGRATVSELKLTRVEDTRQLGGRDRPRNWCLDADQLQQLFATRLISRKDAAKIQDIANTKF